MPVSKSAKKALKVGARRHDENLDTKQLYKRAVKAVKKAVQEGTAEIASFLSAAQSSLDTAAKKHVIHRNKASRLASRLSKRAKVAASNPTPVVAARKKSSKASTTRTRKKA